MKISYQRTGGFAGMVISFSIYTDELSSDEIEELKNLVAAADFFELPSKIESNELVPDQFQYIIAIETDEQQHTVEVGDVAVPEKLGILLNKLRVLSRTTRNQ
jgi:hypothetical protein